MILGFFEKSSLMRSKAGGFVTGGVAMDRIWGTFRLSEGKIVPFTSSDIFHDLTMDVQ
jgi:hypothetical protein